MSPVLLLHGFTGSPRSWDAVVEALPQGTPVLRPTLLGHGEDGGDAPTFDAEVDRLAALLERDGAAPAVLVGYSLGGRLALGLLARHPARFGRAILVGAHPGLADPEPRAARVASDERWARMLETEGIEAFVDAWERQPLFAEQARLPEPVRARRRAIRLGHDARGLARSLRVLGLGRMPDRHPVLGRIRTPVRLVAGERDARFRALAEGMARAWGGPAETVLVPGAGHDAVLAAPAILACMIANK